jgi:DedD protein
MRWALWRNDDAGAADRSPPAGDDGASEAAELRARTRRRLIGAAALLALAVIALPMLLEPARRPVPENMAITVAKPRAVAERGMPERRQEPLPTASVTAEQRPETVAKVAVPAPVRPVPAAAVPPANATASAETQVKSAPAATPPPKDAPERLAATPPAAERSALAATADRYALQVAALATAASADELVARLSLNGFRAYVEAVATADGTRHRVRVGPFASRADAQRAGERLKASGYDAVLVGG